MTEAGAESEVGQDSEAENEAVAAPQEASEDEMKRKFREALDRKRQAQADGSAAGGGRSSSKVRGTHGPVAGRRSFRRKSG